MENGDKTFQTREAGVKAKKQKCILGSKVEVIDRNLLASMPYWFNIWCAATVVFLCHAHFMSATVLLLFCMILIILTYFVVVWTTLFGLYYLTLW